MQTIKQLITAAAGYSSSIGGRTLLVQGCDQGSTLNITLTDTIGNRNTVYNVGAGAKLTPATGFASVDIQTSVDANVVFVVTNGDIDVQLSQVGSTIANTNANPVPVAIVSEPGAPFQVTAGADLPVKNGANPFHVTVDGSVNVTGATLTATSVSINNTSASPVPVLLHASDDATAIPVSGTVNIGNAVGSPVPVSLVSSSDATAIPVTLTGSTDSTAIPVQAQPVATTPSDVAAVAVTVGGVTLLAASAGRKAFRVRNAGNGQLAITAASGTTFANAAVVLQPGDMWTENEAPAAAWYAISDAGTTANLQVLS